MTQGMEELGRGTLLWKLSREVLGKDSTDYIPTGEHPETDLLFLKLNLLLDRGDFNKAEDMLFEAAEEELPGIVIMNRTPNALCVWRYPGKGG